MTEPYARGPGPKRIQRSRKRGWRMPEGARCVTRPSRWGNPFYLVGDGSICGRPWAMLTAYPMPRFSQANTVGDVLYVSSSDHDYAVEHAVDLFAKFCKVRIRDTPTEFDRWIAPLRGRDLCCYCPLDSPCHGDVLLELANA